MLVGPGRRAGVGKHVVDRKEDAAFLLDGLLGDGAGLVVLGLLLAEPEHLAEDGVVDHVVVGPAGEEGLEDESEPARDLPVVLEREPGCLLFLEDGKALGRVPVAQLDLRIKELQQHLLEEKQVSVHHFQGFFDRPSQQLSIALRLLLSLDEISDVFLY